MSISAQLAQNTKLYIGSGTGSAVTITAITKAFRAEITGTHALSKGDRVTFASVAGMTEINTLVGTVIATTSTTSFVVDIDSRAFSTYTSGGTATPVTWTQIKEVKSIKPSGASSTKIDVTDLDSTAKEYQVGLVDHGTFSADINILESDAGQIAALAAFGGSLKKDYKIVSPAKTRTFTAVCLKWPTAPDSSIDGVQTGSAEFQISGAITVS
jgi:hypothetical protein